MPIVTASLHSCCGRWPLLNILTIHPLTETVQACSKSYNHQPSLFVSNISNLSIRDHKLSLIKSKIHSHSGFISYNRPKHIAPHGREFSAGNVCPPSKLTELVTEYFSILLLDLLTWHFQLMLKTTFSISVIQESLCFYKMTECGHLFPKAFVVKRNMLVTVVWLK